jgi:hypothetical protein
MGFGNLNQVKLVTFFSEESSVGKSKAVPKNFPQDIDGIREPVAGSVFS